jgi:hypothetical protein
MVGEPLAFDAFDGEFRAVNIAETKGDTLIVTEVVFGKIAVQMHFIAMLIDAAHPALEDHYTWA